MVEIWIFKNINLLKQVNLSGILIPMKRVIRPSILHFGSSKKLPACLGNWNSEKPRMIHSSGLFLFTFIITCIIILLGPEIHLFYACFISAISSS